MTDENTPHRDPQPSIAALSRIRRFALSAALVVAIAIFLVVVRPHYPIHHWLFWRYASYWVLGLAWALASVSAGSRIISWILPRTALPLLERALLCFALGAFAFQLAMFVLGVVGLLKAPLFFVLPTLFFVIGWRPLRAWTRPAWRHLRWARRRSAGPPVWMLALILFGCLEFALIYFAILTPNNVQFDARWRHMALAEDYVAAGRIHSFPEGWVFAASPHAASYLYAWAFLLPFAGLFDHVELGAHLEFIVFMVTTLIGIPAVVRRLVPRADPRLTWIARFLFPGVLLYDSSLSGGADHIGALFGPAIFLALLRAYPKLAVRPAVLLGMTLAAAAGIKETVALQLVPVPTAFVIARGVQLIFLRRRGRLSSDARNNGWIGPITVVITALVFTTPHWLKNLAWYGDPFYPLLHRFFHAHPWGAEARYEFTYGFQEESFWAAPRSLYGVWLALKNSLTFSFRPNDWRHLHGDVPVFGSLFTLLLMCLPFLRKTKRIWALVGWLHGALFIWYWVHHQDRHLQDSLPLFAAATAAMITLVWRAGRVLPRVLLSLLLALQVIWGGDIYFFPTHSMLHMPPVKAVADLLTRGIFGEYSERLTFEPELVQVGALVPADGRLLLHEQRAHLGVGVPTVTDFVTEQYAIYYDALATPNKVFRRLRSLGVTHLAWTNTSSARSSLSADIVFFDFAYHYANRIGKVRDYTVASLPTKAPDPRERAALDSVLLLSCGKDYASGLYDLEALRAPMSGPLRKHRGAPTAALRRTEDLERMVRNAGAAVVDARCARPLFAPYEKEFSLVAKRNGEDSPPYLLFLRGVQAP